MDQGRSETEGLREKIIRGITGKKPQAPLAAKPPEVPMPAPKVEAPIAVKAPEEEYYSGIKFNEKERRFLEQFGLKIFKLHENIIGQIRKENEGADIAKPRPISKMWLKGKGQYIDQSFGGDNFEGGPVSGHTEVAVADIFSDTFLSRNRFKEYSIWEIYKDIKSRYEKNYSARWNRGQGPPNHFMKAEAIFVERMFDALTRKMREQGIPHREMPYGNFRPSRYEVSGIPYKFANPADLVELFLQDKKLPDGQRVMPSSVRLYADALSYDDIEAGRSNVVRRKGDGGINPYMVDRSDYNGEILSLMSTPHVMPMIIP